jgi:hypothetical protein
MPANSVNSDSRYQTMRASRFSVPVNLARQTIDDMANSYATTHEPTSDYLQSWLLDLESYSSPNVPGTYQALQEACNKASNYTQWTKLLYEYCGGLSKPSKLPGFSWSIPAHFCHTGSKLQKLSGSTCQSCYALKRRYVIPNVKLAMARRLATIKTDTSLFYSTFVLVLSSFLNWNLENSISGVDAGYFRWFDSGDIQDYGMLRRIVEIAELCPNVRFWLPTREATIIAKVPNVPPNLVIRYSTPMVDVLSKMPGSTMVASNLQVLPDSCQICPATTTDDHTCSGNNCRSCWNSGHIAYLKH